VADFLKFVERANMNAAYCHIDRTSPVTAAAVVVADPARAP
jgi:hypothetical protein